MEYNEEVRQSHTKQPFMWLALQLVYRLVPPSHPESLCLALPVLLRHHCPGCCAGIFGNMFWEVGSIIYEVGIPP
jgi:hypothetical protein